MTTQTHPNSSSPESANRLANEISPYLIQHAHNPVNWFPWGEEAFSLAKRENKLIFLSIGYSTCHWCHVMAHESFEDQEIADYLNAHFISIKVDREERPDIDRIYMAATQAITGAGGWPMTVFLLPDRAPIYAGTYFPPRAKFGRPGFIDLLQALIKARKDNPAGIAETAAALTDHLQNMGNTKGAATVDPDLPAKTFQLLQNDYDREYGGFGAAPKFPRPVNFSFLLAWHEQTGNVPALDMVLATLRKMAAGGMYDQLGGGFHRYSVDGQWRVPHFEKMLYDQAQLAVIFFEAFAVSKDPFFRRIGQETLDYVLRDMTDSSGGFFSAEDADSTDPDDAAKHGEGSFYLWKSAEIAKLLDADEADVFTFYYGVTTLGNALDDPMGEFTGRNILYVAATIEETAAKFNENPKDIESILVRAKEKLFLARAKRPRPHLDDKILCSWNGLMLSAFAKGFHVTGNPAYRDAAKKAADFLLSTLLEEESGTLLRRYRLGHAGLTGQLDDYAYLAQGLIDLADAFGDEDYRNTAIRLTEKQIDLFSDLDGGGFFETPDTDATLIARMKNDYDGAEPAANSVAAENLLRLAPFGREEWKALAGKTIDAFGGQLNRFPPAMPLMVCAFLEETGD
ncbi:MAG: thioredoxin domain-containing protein [Pseudomonadota bacterium]